MPTAAEPLADIPAGSPSLAVGGAVAVLVTEEVLAGRPVPPSSLDDELMDFGLRPEERLPLPPPIPGLPDVAPGAMAESGVESLTADAPEDFTAEIAAVTSELRDLDAQQACAAVLEKVAARLRSGQIHVAATTATDDAAVLATVLASLLSRPR